MPIIYRSSRPAGSQNGLTNAEIDANFTDLDTRVNTAQNTANNAIAGLAPVVITASTTLTQAAHANRQLHINSSAPVTLTLPSSATLPCNFYGVNLGSGAVTIVQTGGTAVPANAILPSSIDQFSAFEVWKTSSSYVRLA